MECSLMRTPIQAALRLTFAGLISLAGLLTSASQLQAAAPPENTLPDTTLFFVKANNVAKLREAFKQSQIRPAPQRSCLQTVP